MELTMFDPQDDLCEADGEAYAADIDDGPHRCPDCEKPNQFGELCPDCDRERRITYNLPPLV
jgi:hypothetical protein